MNDIALDPRAFEEHVRCAAEAKSGHLSRVIKRHAPDVSVVVGELDVNLAEYDWRTGVLTLTPETARGQAMRSLLIVAHECAHAQQRIEMPWLPWWVFKVPIVRLIVEEDAWRRALAMLS